MESAVAARALRLPAALNNNAVLTRKLKPLDGHEKSRTLEIACFLHLGPFPQGFTTHHCSSSGINSGLAGTTTIRFYINKQRSTGLTAMKGVNVATLDFAEIANYN